MYPHYHPHDLIQDKRRCSNNPLKLPVLTISQTGGEGGGANEDVGRQGDLAGDVDLEEGRTGRVGIMVFHFVLEMVEMSITFWGRGLAGGSGSLYWRTFDILRLQFFFSIYKAFLFFLSCWGLQVVSQVLVFSANETDPLFSLSIGEGDNANSLSPFPTICHSPSAFPSVLFVWGFFLWGGGNGSSLWLLVSFGRQTAAGCQISQQCQRACLLSDTMTATLLPLTVIQLSILLKYSRLNIKWYFHSPNILSGWIFTNSPHCIACANLLSRNKTGNFFYQQWMLSQFCLRRTFVLRCLWYSTLMIFSLFCNHLFVRGMQSLGIRNKISHMVKSFPFTIGCWRPGWPTF